MPRVITRTAAEVLQEAIDVGLVDTYVLLQLLGLDPEEVDTETTTVELRDGAVTVAITD